MARTAWLSGPAAAQLNPVWILSLLACFKTSLPGRSHRGDLPRDPSLEASTARIEAHIHTLATVIGPRSFDAQPRALAEAERYIYGVLEGYGYVVQRQKVAEIPTQGFSTGNLIATLEGAQPPLVVGAHFDTFPNTPGADDNASGVAALLELAHQFRDAELGREVQFVAWTTEEPPFFETEAMGSAVHARAAEEVFAALSIETIGLYTSDPDSQSYPPPLSWAYPSTGDFVLFVGNPRSRTLMKRAGRTFREAEPFPSRGAIAPAWVTGVDWSDHRSYWAIGAPALMVTDTALFRNPHYHHPTDVEAIIDAEHIARVTRGLEAVVRDLATLSERERRNGALRHPRARSR